MNSGRTENHQQCGSYGRRLSHCDYQYLSNLYSMQLIKFMFRDLTAILDNLQHRQLRIKQCFPKLGIPLTIFATCHNLHPYNVISPHPNTCNFTCFSNMFFLRRGGPTPRGDSKHIRNRARASGRAHLQHIRSSYESVQVYTEK